MVWQQGEAATNEHGQWEMGAVSFFAQEGESGGGVSGYWKDFWHPSSTIESPYTKLTPSPQVSHSIAAAGGWGAIEGNLKMVIKCHT